MSSQQLVFIESPVIKDFSESFSAIQSSNYHEIYLKV